MLIAKALNLTGIAGGYCSSLTSSLGTIAKAHKNKKLCIPSKIRFAEFCFLVLNLSYV